jgi:nucleotide-binding universal stress UspA family protein
MKKILIALDYDPTAQKVAETGFKLAKSLCAEVVLLHIITNDEYYTSPKQAPIMGFDSLGPWKLLEDSDDVREQIQKSLEEIKNNFGNESTQILIKEGDFAKSIIEAAEELQLKIIVMGSHSRKWFEDIVMGSVTEKVLKHTSIPVFIVPTGKKK